MKRNTLEELFHANYPEGFIYLKSAAHAFYVWNFNDGSDTGRLLRKAIESLPALCLDFRAHVSLEIRIYVPLERRKINVRVPSAVLVLNFKPYYIISAHNANFRLCTP